MAAWKRQRRLRVRRWPGEDWEYAHVFYRFLKTFVERPVIWASRLHVRGAHNVPKEGPVLLAANHLSWADPVVLSAAIHRPAFYLAKEGVFRHPLTRWIVTATGQIKVDRTVGGNDGAVSTALGLLGQGLVVGVFPEGTRSRPGQVKRGKTGIARIAAASGAIVVPVAIESGDFWPRGRSVPRLGRQVYINIGAPFHLDIKADDVADKKRMREATDEVMDRVRALYKEAVEAREAKERWA